MKKCRDCRRELSNDSFHKDKTNRDRLRTRCKDCRSKLASVYWEANWKRITAVKKKVYDQLKKDILSKYGNKCNKCGFEDWRALQVDHVNGGGSARRNQTNRNWHKFYREVLNDKAREYQLLCANCNWIKRYENRENDTKRHEP